MPHPLVSNLLQSWPLELWQDQSIVLAVSGGADSVALLRAVCEIHSHHSHVDRLHVAHLNHGWRGTESDMDEQFVVQLSHALGISCTVHRLPPQPESSKSEQAARKARHAFFKQVAHHRNAHFVATAHTASDRVETMLHNLCRGTGLSGVCSPTLSRPLDANVTLVRPLIASFREEVIDYLASLSQTYRVDTSNLDQSYRRNFLRHSILPSLREVYGPGLDSRLISFSQLAEETLLHQQVEADQYWSQAVLVEQEALAENRLPVRISNELRLPCEKLLPTAWPIVLLSLQKAWHELHWKQQAMSRAHWEKLRTAWQKIVPPVRNRVRKPKSLFHLPGGLKVTACHGWLTISAHENVEETQTQVD